MTATYCPACYEPVPVAPHAREGRCAECRPRRQHSIPRREPRDFHLFARLHNRGTA